MGNDGINNKVEDADAVSWLRKTVIEKEWKAESIQKLGKIRGWDAVTHPSSGSRRHGWE